MADQDRIARRAMRKAKAKRILRDWGIPIFWGATAGAAWCGWKGAIKANRLERELERTQEVVNHNAMCSMRDRERMLHIQDQQNELLERALNITEGKTEKSD